MREGTYYTVYEQFLESIRGPVSLFPGVTLNLEKLKKFNMGISRAPEECFWQEWPIHLLHCNVVGDEVRVLRELSPFRVFGLNGEEKVKLVIEETLSFSPERAQEILNLGLQVVSRELYGIPDGNLKLVGIDIDTYKKIRMYCSREIENACYNAERICSKLSYNRAYWMLNLGQQAAETISYYYEIAAIGAVFDVVKS